MELDEILKGLYSQNKNEILSVINIAYHASLENYPEIGRCIHTGFYCKTHKEKILGFIFCIDNHELYFQGGSQEPYPLGAYMLPNKSAVGYCGWIVLQKPYVHSSQYPYIHSISYDVDNNELTCEVANHIDKNNQAYYTINGNKFSWKQFSVIRNKVQSFFELYTPTVYTFYCGGEGKFRLM